MKVKVSYSPNLSEVNEIDLTIETTTRGEWLIGRSPDSDLLLDSPDISRVHAKFFVKGGNYYFCDLGSRNGSIFNGKQAEKERPYSLSDGDVIRIADYVLILEAVAPAYEQPETVFRIIDPSLFSRSRSPENIKAADIANSTPEVVKEVETPEINPSSPEIKEISEVVAIQSDDVIPVVEVIAPENIIQPPAAVSADAKEVPLTITDHAIAPAENIIETPEQTNILPEATDNNFAESEAALAAESTFVQRRDTSPIPEPISDADAELEAALEAEVTFVQPRDIFHQVPPQTTIPEATSDADAELEAALAAEITIAQPREVFNEISEDESTVPEATDDELDTPVAEKNADFGEFVNNFSEGEDIQQPEILNQVTTEDSVDVDEPVSEVSQTSTAPDNPDNIVVEVISTQYIDLTNGSIEEVSVDVAPVSEVSELADIQSLEISVSPTIEQVSEVEAIQPDEIPVSELANIQSLEISESVVIESVSPTIEQVSEVEAIQPDEIPEAINVSEPPPAIIERNIVLIAHESKKSELAEFVSQHQEFFSQSFTISWPSVSEVLHQEAGITISQQTPSAISGGYQTIASLVGAGEILAVIFLRDLLQPQPGQTNEESLLRLCTINQVLLATNLPTAEAIVHYLKHI